MATVLQRVDLGDRVAIADAPALSVTGFAGDTLVRDALAALAAAAGVEPRWQATIAKRIPVAAGLGGGSSDAATALRWPTRCCRGRSGPPSCRPASAWALTCRFSSPTAPNSAETAPYSTARSPAQDYWIVLALPHGVTKPSTAAVYRHFDERNTVARLGGAPSCARAARARRRPPPARPRRLPPNDLASSPLATELLRLGAFRADVSGAGPAVYGLFHHRRHCRRRLRALRPSRAPGAPCPSGTGEDRSGYARGGGPSGDHRARDDALRRALRDGRLRIALLVALVEGILVLVGSIDWWVVVLLAVGAVVLYVSWGRAAPRQEVREGSWIFAVSQLGGRPRPGARGRAHRLRGRRARHPRRRRPRPPASRPPLACLPEPGKAQATGFGPVIPGSNPGAPAQLVPDTVTDSTLAAVVMAGGPARGCAPPCPSTCT